MPRPLLKLTDYGVVPLNANRYITYHAKFVHGAPEAMPAPDGRALQYKGEPADIWQCGLILLRMTGEQRAVQASFQNQHVIDAFSDGSVRYKWAPSWPGAKLESYFDAWDVFCRSDPAC